MFEDSDIVSTYTRAQAIGDGVLVDVSEKAKEAGFKISVALTAAVFTDCVQWAEEDTKRTGAPQDEEGRLWDVLYMANRALTSPHLQNGAFVPYGLFRVSRHRPDPRAELVNLVLSLHPGDEGEPVITIRLPDED